MDITESREIKESPEDIQDRRKREIRRRELAAELDNVAASGR